RPPGDAGREDAGAVAVAAVLRGELFGPGPLGGGDDPRHATLRRYYVARALEGVGERARICAVWRGRVRPPVQPRWLGPEVAHLIAVGGDGLGAAGVAVARARVLLRVRVRRLTQPAGQDAVRTDSVGDVVVADGL